MVISGNPVPGIRAVCIKLSSFAVVDCTCQRLQIFHGRNKPRVIFRSVATSVGGHCSCILCQRRRGQKRQAQGQRHGQTQNSFFHRCPPLVFPRPDRVSTGREYPVGFPYGKRGYPRFIPFLGSCLIYSAMALQRKVAIWPRVQVELGSKWPPPTPVVMPFSMAQATACA